MINQKKPMTTHTAKIDWDVLRGIRFYEAGITQIGPQFRLKLDFVGVYKNAPMGEMFTLNLIHTFSSAWRKERGLVRMAAGHIIKQFIEELKRIAALGSITAPIYENQYEIGFETKFIKQIYSVKMAHFIHDREPSKLQRLVNFPGKEKYEAMLKGCEKIPGRISRLETRDDPIDVYDIPILLQQALKMEIDSAIVRMYDV